MYKSAIMYVSWVLFTMLISWIAALGTIFLRRFTVEWLAENPISPYQSLPHTILNADGLFLVGCIFTWVIISLFMWKWGRR